MSPPRAPSITRSAAKDDGDQRIAKLLARAGVASRREIERMIAEGRVALNGSILTTPATVLPSLDGVTVDGEPVEAPAPARLFLYHKPAGLLVTERDPAGRPTIYDRLPAGLPRVVPVGRLDLGTEGLLLLTTDGGLKRQLELPATGVERAYRARAYGEVTQQMLESLIEGVEIEGVRYGSIDANLERRTGANVWIEMILTEGKNREVRRVLEYLGLQVSRLIRTRYGPFVLGDLTPGAVTEVRGHDIASFRKNPTRLDLPQPARQRGAAVEPTRATFEPRATGRTPRPVAEAVDRGGPARATAGSKPPLRTERPAATAGRHRPDTGGSRDNRSARPAREETVTARPARGAPATATSRKDATSAGPAGGRGGARSARPPRRDETAGAVAKPARAARARTFRENRDPDERPAPARPPGPDARPGSPRRPGADRTAPGGPGKRPRGGPPRPPRTRS